MSGPSDVARARFEMKKTMRRIVQVMLLAFVACVASASLQAGDAQHLSGSWAMTITAVEPPGLPPFKGLITFTRDGEVIETRRLYVPATPFGPLLETPGHGAWRRSANGRFAVFFQFLLQAAPNNPIFANGEDLGTDNIRLQIEPDSAGDSFTGTFVSQVKDPDGSVVFEARGTVAGTRIRAEPEDEP
jgi:hypothetical protein